MAEIKTAFCEYDGCDKEFNVADMEVLDGDSLGELVYVCMPCYERMEDSSGYCSVGCQLGYGCDDSC